MANPLDFNPLNVSAPAASAAPKPFDATTPGIISNTIGGLLGNVPIAQNPWLKVAADIGQGIARTVGSIGLTAMNKTFDVLGTPISRTAFGAPAGKPLFNTEGLAQPVVQVPDYLKPIFGDGQDIKDVPQRIAESVSQIKANPFAQKMGLDTHAAPLALGSIIGNTYLDLSGLGGEESAYKELARETNPEIIAGMLEKTGLSPEVASQVAPHVASVSRPKDVKNILDVAKSMHGLEVIADGEKAAAGEAAPATEAAQDPNAPAAYTPPTELTPAAADAHLNDLNTPEIQAARDTTANREPTALIDTPARDDLRDSIVNKAYGEGAAVQGKRLDLVIGAPASGKSGLAEELAAEHGSLIADADAIKKMIPEYGPRGDGSQVVHAESQALASRVRAMARENGDNTVLQTIGHDPAQIRKNVQIYKDAGYDVHLHLMELPPEKAAARAVQRYADGGHFIDPKYILKEVGLKPSTSYDIVKGDEGIKSFQKLSNDVGKGEAPTLVERGGSGIQKESERLGLDAVSGGRGTQLTAKEARQAIKDTPPTARTPAQQLALLDAGKDGKSWSALLKGFSSNLTGVQKAHILDYAGTPEFVLEKIGLGKGAEMLQDAKLSYRKNLGKEISKIEDWRKRVGTDPLASTRIFRYLDGQAKDVHHEMSNTELAVADEMKDYLKEWADRLKLPEDNRLSSYITHIFDENAGDEVKNVFDEDPELASIMADRPAGSVYDPFVQKRLGKKGYKEDVWAALDAYVKRGTRKEAMDPALEFLKNEAGKLDDYSYNYVKDLTHRINMRPTEFDKGVDNLIQQTPVLNKMVKGVRPIMRISQKLRSIYYRGTLGLNMSTALRNLSQGANTYAKLGEKHTIIGYTKLFSRLLTNNLGDLKEAGVLADELIQDKKIGVYKSLMQKLDPVLFAHMELSEKINRGAAFYGAISKYKSKFVRTVKGQEIWAKGASMEQATKYAARIVRETQFAFGAVDSPVVLGSDVMKTAFQLESFSVKQMEFLGRMVKNKEVGGLIRYTLASTAFLFSIGKLFGMTAGQLFPTVGLGGSPIGNLATGVAELFSTNAQTKADGKSKISRDAVALIPAGNQIKKTVQGIQAYAAGRDKTATGKTRFKIPKGTGSLLQNAVFGKSSTPEAQKYYKKLDAPAKKKSAKKGNPLD